MKYRIRYIDPTNDGWLWFTPLVLFAFLFAFMGVKGKWVIEQKKHWWNKWKIIEEYDKANFAHIRYFKLRYNIDIKEFMIFPHNKHSGEYVTCHLEFKYNDYSKDYKYTVGYKPRNYVNYYHCCYSSESYEDAMMKLYNDILLKKIIDRKKESIIMNKINKN